MGFALAFVFIFWVPQYFGLGADFFTLGRTQPADRVAKVINAYDLIAITAVQLGTNLTL